MGPVRFLLEMSTKQGKPFPVSSESLNGTALTWREAGRCPWRHVQEDVEVKEDCSKKEEQSQSTKESRGRVALAERGII